MAMSNYNLPGEIIMAVTTEVMLDPEKEYEIVDGQPEEKEMPGARHGGVSARLIVELGMHIKINKLGGIYGPDTTFQIGKNERLPDVAFVAAERIPEEGEPEGKWAIAPDLAIEVISPNDLWEKLSRKIRDYFDAGVREVWLISPEFKTVTIYHSVTRTTILTEEDDLTTEIIPGFRCKISDLFKSPARS
jgi:Uma2 family endonuclease